MINLDIFNENINKTNLKELISKYHICLCSGHGFNTAGKRSPDGTLRENEFNSAVEDKIAYVLDMVGIGYSLIAPEWNDVPLAERSRRERAIARYVKDEGKRVIGVAIHADAFTQSQANGYTTFYYNKSAKGKGLAGHINTCVTSTHLENNFKLYNRGVRSQNFHILRETIGIWCLIECAFMTNPQDLEHLKNDRFRNSVAKGILRGLFNYMYNSII